jgi:signal peptidase I
MNRQEKKQQSFLSSVTEFLFLLMVVFFIRTFFFGLYQVPTGSMETTMLVGERFFADKFSYNFRKPYRGEIIAFNGPEFNYSPNPLMRLFQRYVWGPDNWTKRVIGIPGDIVKGTIENGKPVVYLNGEKLQEDYINKYPLIRTWRHSLDEIYKSIENELQQMARKQTLDRLTVDRYVAQRLSQEIASQRSYDPDLPYNEQTFYRIDENCIYCDEDGNPDIRKPGLPLPSNNKKTEPDTTVNNWDGSDVFYVKLGEKQYWCMGDNRLGSHDCRFFGPIKEEDIHGRIIGRIWSIDSDEAWWIVDLIKHPIDFWTRIRWSRFFQIMH